MSQLHMLCYAYFSVDFSVNRVKLIIYVVILLRDIPFFIRTPPPPPPLRMAGGSDFVFKEADKIWTLQKFFSKVPKNNQPFGFHFSKGTGKKLRVRIPAILRGGALKKWNVPTSEYSCELVYAMADLV